MPEDLISIKESKPQVSKKIFERISTGNSFKKTINAALAQTRNKPIVEAIQKGSSDSSDAKHVKIKENVPVTIHGTVHKHRDTINLKKTHERKQKKMYQSPSRSSSSKDLREDSLTSNWSDNIPVITISKTESAENILRDSPKQSQKTNIKPKQKLEKQHVSEKSKWDKIKPDKRKSKEAQEKIIEQLEKKSSKEGNPEENTDKERVRKEKRHESRIITERYREEKRISKSRISNLERTLDTIQSSNDNLDSDPQETPPQNQNISNKESAASDNETLPEIEPEITIEKATTSKETEFKRNILKKQVCEVVIDDDDQETEHTVVEVESQVMREGSRISSNNGSSIQTSDTLRTESSTDYKDEIFSQDNLL